MSQLPFVPVGLIAMVVMLAPLGWFLLTLVCSARMARAFVDEERISGAPAFLLTILLAPPIALLHAGAAYMVISLAESAMGRDLF